VGTSDRARGARASSSLQVICHQITQGFVSRDARVHLDPGDGNIMMGADLLKLTTDVLNECLITSSLDRIIPPKRRTQCSLSVIKLMRRRIGVDPIRVPIPRTRVQETSRRTAVMASGESVGKRTTLKSVVSSAVFQFPRQIL